MAAEADTGNDRDRDQDNAIAVAAAEAGTPAKATPPGRLAVWEHRIFVASLVMCASVFGILLVAIPWTPLWTANAIILRHPDWLNLVNHPFLRGSISGLGLLDLWIAFGEALGYRDP